MRKLRDYKLVGQLLRGFPTGRAAAALLIVPAIPFLAEMALGALLDTFLPANTTAHSSYLYNSIVFARQEWWVAYLVFAVLGVPTVYLLHRRGRAEFGWFALFGAVYTGIAGLSISPYAARGLPLLAVLGALEGILTRLIVFGTDMRRQPAVEEATGDGRKNFPIGRTVVAFFVAPQIPLILLSAIVSAFHPHWEWHPTFEWALALLWPLLMIPIVPWPAYAVFLAIGAPTLYMLYRLNRLSFALFAFFGALYTGLTALLLITPRSADMALTFAGVGALDGILVRLIVFGRRWT